MRTCKMCGTSIEHRNGNTKYCKECAEVRKKSVTESQAKEREKTLFQSQNTAKRVVFHLREGTEMLNTVALVI